MDMDSLFARRVTALRRCSVLDWSRCFTIGLEKEALRVTQGGAVAATPHPPALGAALTHPWITTDFSEALLELITPPLDDVEQALAALDELHRFVAHHLGDERLWATSMPCVLGGDAEIPLARYGFSNPGQMKTVYRRGLGNRYGRTMQAIAGVHLNVSFAEPIFAVLREDAGAAHDPRAFRDDLYMGMVRNLQRVGWLVPYLFGASPAVCKSFVRQAPTDLHTFDAHTYYYPHATSLRMGDIGYQNRQEEGTGMKACYDSLDAYIRSLTWGIETSCPLYERIGVKVNGRYEQLNDHVLQIENEYYSTVRPKQIVDWMERPTLALRRRGIRYVELRSLDVNGFLPLGVDAEQLRLLCALMLYSLLRDSPRIDARERRAIDANQVAAAHRGREPGLLLERGESTVPLRDWATEILGDVQQVAILLDAAGDEEPVPRESFRASVAAQRAKVADPERTPSARVLAEMRAESESFVAHARRWTEQHWTSWRQHPLDATRTAELSRLAAVSWERQRLIEANDPLDFDRFLARYFAQSEQHPVALPVPFGD